MLLFKGFNIFEKDICLIIEIITLGLDIKDVLIIFVPEILVLLRLFYKLTGLVVECVSFAGGLACSCIKFIATVFVFFRLGKSLLSLFHKVIQHALQLLIRFSFSFGSA